MLALDTECLYYVLDDVVGPGWKAGGKRLSRLITVKIRRHWHWHGKVHVRFL
jgi:hypothetical protein